MRYQRGASYCSDSPRRPYQPHCPSLRAGSACLWGRAAVRLPGVHPPLPVCWSLTLSGLLGCSDSSASSQHFLAASISFLAIMYVDR